MLSGKSTKLDPTLIASGVECSLMLRFFSHPETGDKANQNDVATGVIQAIIPIGDNLFKIVFERGMVPFSYTLARGVGDTIEAQYEAACGGNVIDHHEGYRFYNWLSDRAVRGSLKQSRGTIYDVLFGGVPSEGYFITECRAFGYPNEVVNYNPPAGRPVKDNIFFNFPGETISGDFYPIRLSTALNGGVNDFGSSPIFDDAGVYLNNTKLTRRIFAGDASKYPADAEMALGEFWFDELRGEVILASLNESIGDSALLAWYEKGLGRFKTEISQTIIVQDEGSVFFETRADFSYGLAIIKEAAGYGLGDIAIKFGSRTFNVKFSNSIIEEVTDNGTPLFIVPNSPFTGLLFTLTVEKLDGFLNFYHQDLGTPARTLFCQVDISGFADGNITGQLSITSRNDGEVKFAGTGVGVDMQRTAGTVSQLMIKSYNGLIFSKDYTLKEAGYTISSARYGTYSTAGTARRRNHVQDLGANTIRVFSDTAPDAVVIDYPTPTGPPALTRGRCPRTLVGQKNFATPVTPIDSDFEANANVAENVANWSDYAIVYSDNMKLEAGQSITIRRNCVLIPYEPYNLQFSLKGRGDLAEWLDVPRTDYVARPVEGIFLIGKAFLDAHPGAICFRLTGFFITHHGNLNARQIVELQQTIDYFSECHFTIQLGGQSSAISGRMYGKQIGFAKDSTSCVDYHCFGIAGALDFGQPRVYWEKGPYSYFNFVGLIDRMNHAGVSFPFFVNANTGPIQLSESGTGAMECDTATVSTIHLCCPTIPAGFTKQSEVVTSRLIEVAPETFPNLSGVADGENCYGVPPPPEMGNYFNGAQFRLAGIGLGIPKQIKNAPIGTIVKSALGRIKFNGLKVYKWSVDLIDSMSRSQGGSIGLYPGVRTISWQLTVNDVVVQRYVWVGSDPPLININIPWTHATEVEMGYSLIARRLKTANIFDPITADLIFWLGENSDPTFTPTAEQIEQYRQAATLNYESGDYAAMGAGITAPTTIRDGEWAIGDFTNVYQALMDTGRFSPYNTFQLVPNRAGINLGSGTSAMAAYLKAIDSTHNLTHEAIDNYWFDFHLTGSGEFVTWTGIEYENVQISLEPPSPNIVKAPPIVRTQMMRTP